LSSIGPVPGEQLVEAIDGIACDEAGEDIGEVGFGIEVVQFAGRDERGEDCPVLAAAIGACEECVLPI
jgi:hypothetical protein